MNSKKILSVLGASALALSANAETMLESFEYGTDDELLSMWSASGSTIMTMTNDVAAHATGTNALMVTFNFPELSWASEQVSGTYLETPVSIDPAQFFTYRLKGDPAFASANFSELYLKVWDINGNCGRYQIAVPKVAEWQIVNHLASSVALSWDCTVPPDLSQLVRFAFLQYGSGEAAIPAYTATICVDELMIRDTPLTEFPPASPTRELIDDFEGYADDAALSAFYSPENSPATTTTTVSLSSPAPQGSKAIKLAVDLAPGQWPWGSVRSPILSTPFSIPSNAVVSLKLKGDPSFESIADGGTTFWISFYDKGGARINYSTGPTPVTSSEWTTLEIPVSQFWGNLETIDLGTIVQWRILFEGWEGTAESEAKSGAIYVDDIRITVPRPALSIAWAGTDLSLTMTGLTPGKSYDVRTSQDLQQWTTATTIDATAATASWTITANQNRAFYRLVEK